MNKRETDIQQPIEIIERSSISKEAEVLLVKDKVYEQTIYQASICLTRLEKPYYSNQLFRIFTDREQALEFYENLCEMKGQDEMVSVILRMGDESDE